MKRIFNKVILSPFDGKPIMVTYDFEKLPDGKYKMEVGPDGKDRPIPKMTEMTTALAIRNFISGFDAKEVAITDSYTAMKILDVLRPMRLLEDVMAGVPKDTRIKLEDAEYEWILKGFKEKGTKSFGLLAGLYVNAIEDLDKVEEPAVSRS